MFEPKIPAQLMRDDAVVGWFSDGVIADRIAAELNEAEGGSAYWTADADLRDDLGRDDPATDESSYDDLASLSLAL